MKLKKNAIKFAACGLALLLILGATACSKSESETTTTTKKTETTTKAKETTTKAETTTAATDTTAATEATTETTTAAQSDNSADCVGITNTLISQWNTLGTVAAGFIDYDANTSWTSAEGITYYKVTDPSYQNFGDLSNLVYGTVSKALASSEFSNVTGEGSGTSNFVYLQSGDVENPGLYMIQSGRGFLTITPTSDITITNATNSSFDASFTYDNYGQQDTMNMHIIYEDGWKIDSVSYQ